MLDWYENTLQSTPTFELDRDQAPVEQARGPVISLTSCRTHPADLATFMIKLHSIDLAFISDRNHVRSESPEDFC